MLLLSDISTSFEDFPLSLSKKLSAFHIDYLLFTGIAFLLHYKFVCFKSKISLVSDLLILPMRIPPTSIKYDYICPITPCTIQ
jgi:ABC-type molybdate transport system permease subunit